VLDTNSAQRADGFYTPSDFPVVNSYTETLSLDTMMKDQIAKMKQYAGQYFIMSWILTQTPEDIQKYFQDFGTPGVYAKSVLDYAKDANFHLPDALWSACSDGMSYPKVILIDRVESTDLTALAIAINVRSLMQETSMDQVRLRRIVEPYSIFDSKELFAQAVLARTVLEALSRQPTPPRTATAVFNRSNLDIIVSVFLNGVFLGRGDIITGKGGSRHYQYLCNANVGQVGVCICVAIGGSTWSRYLKMGQSLVVGNGNSGRLSVFETESGEHKHAGERGKYLPEDIFP